MDLEGAEMGLCPTGFLAKILYAFFISPTLTTKANVLVARNGTIHST
jgi:hypothetical protein